MRVRHEMRGGMQSSALTLQPSLLLLHGRFFSFCTREGLQMHKSVNDHLGIWKRLYFLDQSLFSFLDLDDLVK